MGMTFCQRRKGTRRAGDRAGYVIGEREKRSGDLGMTVAGKRSACRERERIRCFSLVAGTERPRHKHRICIALVLSRLLLPCPLSFLPLGALLDATPSTYLFAPRSGRFILPPSL